MPIRTYNFSEGPHPWGRAKWVYPGTLEHICNCQFADFIFKFFFDNPFDVLGSTCRRPFDLFLVFEPAMSYWVADLMVERFDSCWHNLNGVEIPQVEVVPAPAPKDAQAPSIRICEMTGLANRRQTHQESATQVTRGGSGTEHGQQDAGELTRVLLLKRRAERGATRGRM